MDLKMKNKRGMMNWMISLAYGAFMFVILVTLAVTVGAKLGNSSGDTTANATAQYVITQLGSAGLSGYLGLIFIAAIAIGIISMLGFNARKGGKY
jgi:hypothetical protein